VVDTGTPLAALLGDVRAAAASRYDAKDSLGNRMDTAKVIEHPGEGGGRAGRVLPPDRRLVDG
jgi:hypothetical protein